MRATVPTVQIASQPYRPSIGPAARTAAARDPAVLTLLALTLVAAVLRLHRIGHQSFWYDESYTVNLTRQSVGGMLRLLPRTELTPPLYFLLVWLWAHVFGSGEAALRSLSALGGVATVPVVYLAAAKMAGRRVGLTAAALAACNPLLVWYSQEARSYATLVLFAALSLLAFAYAREPDADGRRFVLWGLSGGLALATHYFGAMAVAPQAIWLLRTHRLDRRLLAVFAGLAAETAALAPLALTQSKQATWIAQWSLAGRLGQIPWQFLLGTGTPARLVLEVVGFAALAVAMLLLCVRAGPPERQVAGLCGAFAAIPILLELALTGLGKDELITRNVIVALIPLIVTVACGLGARRAAVAGTLGAATLCALGVTAAVAVSVTPALQRPDWRGLARAIVADGRSTPGRAILIENYSFLEPLAIDFPGLRTITARGARASELDVVAMHRAPGWFCWWGATCNLTASSLHPRFAPTGFARDGAPIHVGPFSLQRYRAAAATRVTPARVRQAALQAGIYLHYSLLFAPSR